MRPDDVEQTVGYLVKRVQQSLRRHLDAALAPTGLTMAQYAALRALADHPDASAAQLARICFVSRQSLHNVLADLQSANLIREASTRGPGRAIPLALTPAGRRRLTKGHAAVLRVDATMVDALPAASRSQLVSGLIACAERLENLPR